MSISGALATSCWMRPIGKIGVRSSGPAGCLVCGLSGGSGSPGRSGSRLTQEVGICDSSSRYLTVSAIAAAILCAAAGALRELVGDNDVFLEHQLVLGSVR